MNTLRALLANEPRSYRETITAVCQALRPHAEICAVCPDDLRETVLDFHPHLVVCSHVTLPVEETVLAWIELYPGHGRLSHVSIGGKRSTIEKIQLDDVLSIFDAAEILVQTGHASRPLKPGHTGA